MEAPVGGMNETFYNTKEYRIVETDLIIGSVRLYEDDIRDGIRKS